jgi:plastocyanin
MRLRSPKNSIRAVAASLALAATVAAFSAPSGVARSGATTRVTVTMIEYRFRLSVNHVRAGTVVFTVVNKGQLTHTFAIQRLGKVTPIVLPGHRYVFRVTFRKPGTYYYLCTVGAHVQYGMFGNLRVTA